MKNIEFLRDKNINIDASLEILGDIETYNDILNDFLDEINNKINLLTEYKESSDMSNYAIYAHSIKSDAKYLGFTKLATLALEHQLKSEAKDKEFIKNTYEDLILEFDRIVNIVKEYLDK